jgi:hypothetical protein
MKIRTDYVTNSSSSSFVICNNTNETLTSEDVVRKLFERIIEDAKDRFIIEPGESIVYECSDNISDGEFEVFIHNTFDGWGCSSAYNTDDVSIKFNESHH